MAGSYDIQLRELKDTITQLTRTIQSLQKIIEEKESKEAVLQEQIDYLTKKLFGTSSEKRNAQIEGQLYLFNEAEQEEIPDEEDITEVRSHTRKAKKTNADKFASLPVREVVFSIPEDERLCEKCGQIMEEIGKEFVREELQFIPGRFERIRYYNITYRCRNCYENSGENTPFLKNIPPAPLMKHSPASPSSVAWVMYQKYANAMPLYRQEKEWKQQYQVEIKRATMANWIIYCSEHYLKPLYEYFHQEILKRRFLMADETRVQVLKEPDRRAQSDSYMWLYRTGEDGLPTILLYEYTETRARHNAEEFLKGFSGYLETDGYQGYENLPGIKRCCCWAHVRRYFYDAIPAGKKNDLSEPSVQGVEFCDKLFYHERASYQKGHNPDQRKEYRLKKEKPIIDAFWKWVDKQHPVRGSRMDKAMQYTLNRKDYLETYLEDGRCSLSNNLAENAIRPFTVGRKNWLFSDSQRGAQASAICYTIIEMAKAHELNAFKYLNYLLVNREEKDFTLLAPWSPLVKETCRVN